MSVIKVPEFGWGGLNTRSNATGLPLLECTALQDMRVVGTDLVQRKGIYRVQQLGGNIRAFDFNGTTQYLNGAVDTRVWTLGLQWTMEFAIEPDSTAGTQGLVCVGDGTPAIIVDITGGNIRCRVWDSSGTATTITVGAAATSTQTVQIVRDGATISTRLNNGTPVTGSISASLAVRTPVGDLRVARDDGSNFYDGTFDYLRLFSMARSNHNDRLMIHPASRASYVLANYFVSGSATNIWRDHSRYQASLIRNASASEITTLCHNPGTIRALSQSVDAGTNRKQLLALAGGKYYIADLN